LRDKATGRGVRIEAASAILSQGMGEDKIPPSDRSVADEEPEEAGE
jgi:hypothetical protein